MRSNLGYKGVLLTAALCLAPASLLALPKANQPAALGVVNKGAAPGATGVLLQQIQANAFKVEKNAEQLETLLNEPFLSDWQADGGYLDRIRAHVNELNKLAFQLRSGEARDSALQKNVIERIEPTAVDLADTTQDAIVTLNHNQGRVFATNLEGLASDICTQATAIRRTVTEYEKYSGARQELQQFNRTLGLKSRS